MMMFWIISILVYLLSIVGMRFFYRLMSSRYLDKWPDRLCKAEALWFIPIISTCGCIALLFFEILPELGRKKFKNSKSKWLNGDL